MTITLFPHQQVMFDEAREATRTHDGVLIQSATGSGKTIIGTAIAKAAVDRGRRILFTVHRDFLVDQTYEAFSKVGLKAAIIAAGTKPDYKSRSLIASIDTLKNRLDLLEHIDLALIDECHHAPAGGWTKVWEHLRRQGTKGIGLTATPWRLSGEGLWRFFTHMVQGPSVRWLIDNDFLSEYRAYAPTTPNLDGVHTRQGDYVQAEIEAAMDRPTITGDAVNHYLRLAAGRRAVVFCCSIKHSEHVAAQFAAQGITSGHIDQGTPRERRRAIIAAFRKGDIKVLSSVNIFGEGFDIPSVEVAILLRPTQSLTLHLQQIGRALRVFDGKEEAVILDHAGNLLRLGLPDTEYEWSLADREKKKKKAASLPIKMCEVCYFVYSPPAPVCPKCGHVHKTMDRSPEQVDGELKEITPEMRAKITEQKRREVFSARSLDELKEVEKRRGYMPGWAERVFHSREASSRRRDEHQAQSFLRL